MVGCLMIIIIIIIMNYGQVEFVESFSFLQKYMYLNLPHFTIKITKIIITTTTIIIKYVVFQWY